MNIRSLCVSIGFAALAVTAGIGAAAASSAPAPDSVSKDLSSKGSQGKDVSIPFVNHGGIRDWSADRDQGLWVQDSRRNWYYAKLLGPCTGLNFATSIGFDTRSMDTFDRFSSIVVPREGRCMIQSLAPSEGPPAKHKVPAEGPGSVAKSPA